MMTNRVYVLGLKPVHGANYVVGVQATNIYRRIARAPTEGMEIRRACFEDVSHDVNAGLRGRGIEQTYNKIIIDTEAELHVYRGPPLTERQHEEIRMEEFIMYPFRNHLGVIMPYRLKGSHTYEMHGQKFDVDVYSANVIDPVEDFESFRGGLRYGGLRPP